MIVFVKPHDHYSSYTDFWNLVELSGFDWCRKINLKSTNTYIIPAIYLDKNSINFPWKLSWWQRKKKVLG